MPPCYLPPFAADACAAFTRFFFADLLSSSACMFRNANLKNNFCNIVQIKIMHRRNTAIADASPTFWLVCAIVFITTKNVPVPFAPSVITNGASNALSEPVIDRMIFSVTMVLILGRIMYRNCWNLFAPSRSAA